MSVGSIVLDKDKGGIRNLLQEAQKPHGAHFNGGPVYVLPFPFSIRPFVYLPDLYEIEGTDH